MSPSNLFQVMLLLERGQQDSQAVSAAIGMNRLTKALLEMSLIASTLENGVTCIIIIQNVTVMAKNRKLRINNY